MPVTCSPDVDKRAETKQNLYSSVFTITTLVLIAAALTVLVLGIRTTGKTLE